MALQFFAGRYFVGIFLTLFSVAQAHAQAVSPHSGHAAADARDDRTGLKPSKLLVNEDEPTTTVAYTAFVRERQPISVLIFGVTDHYGAIRSDTPLAQQSTRRAKKSIRLALVAVGAAVLGAGSYLVASTPQGWMYAKPIPGPFPTPLIGFEPLRCVNFNPHPAGPATAELRCSPLRRTIGIGLIYAGASTAAAGLIFR